MDKLPFSIFSGLSFQKLMNERYEDNSQTYLYFGIMKNLELENNFFFQPSVSYNITSNENESFTGYGITFFGRKKLHVVAFGLSFGKIEELTMYGFRFSFYTL
jgi:hypothetical protein